MILSLEIKFNKKKTKLKIFSLFFVFSVINKVKTRSVHWPEHKGHTVTLKQKDVPTFKKVVLVNNK